MIRGIQSAASAMMAQLAGQEVVANNLANANTPGYKRDVPSFGAVLANANGAGPISISDPRVGTNLAQGALMETGDRFHLALEGNGFFTIQTPGGPAYTRDGSFTLDKDGYLITQAGDKVLGTSGPIKVGNGELLITEDGRLMQNGTEIAQLKIMRFNSVRQLAKIGGNLYRGTGGTTADPTVTHVRQGYLEGSNVNSVTEMVSMIAGLRTYEASQKAIHAQDETLEKAVNEVGRT